MCDILGDRPTVIGRELTKRFEEVVRGRLSELQTRLHGRQMKGEVALLVAGCSTETAPTEERVVGEEIARLAGQGLSLKEIAGRLSERYGLSKREVYALGLKIKNAQSET